MKLKLFIPAVIAILLAINCYAQEDKYEVFREYMMAHCRPSKIVTDLCGLQLAIVKLTTNKAGHVVDVSFLNEASDSLKVAFKPLLGYQFPLKLKMQNKAFVFAYTFYNLRSDCIKVASTDTQEAFVITYQCLIKQMKANPKTIFYDITTTTIGLDPEIHYEK